MRVIGAVRRRLAQDVFALVAGEDGEGTRQRIHGTPGPRWFPPDAPIRRVHGDTSMYVGGLRALLLQSLHPLAMAAVADHSGYQSDPWGRLARTSTFIAQTTFGTEEESERAIARVRTVHDHITGTAPDGRSYRADDPHLLSWVHVAEVDSFLRAHQRYGRQPLTAAEADTYVAQTATVARKLGAVDVPGTRAELDADLERFRPELEGTAEAREVARFLLRDTPLSRRARLPYALVSAAAVGLLPAWARVPLGLPHQPVAERTVVPLGGRCAVGGLRWLVAAEPVPTADDVATS
ncbi:oxygenase MpaB family protein [Segeticoccus rhizosphaerae]|jgi:uncharacterized protein (DUF2236 family)|uniref:oxygenase MpaB family protein n=1 Tax=Segeticoccus rhizosphaerae TaxID=1104777 RepID=UPI0010C0B2B8|nr:oxygenase MpaB family protein [Ornithinicoccus soli]